MEFRSKTILGEEDSAFARSLFKSMGYTDSELREGKPLIGIANTWNTLVPGHFNLDKVAEYVKNGIYAAGGTPVEFGTIAACDGVAQGHEGMHYILPSREIICNSVEIMAQAHRLDGLVLLASCDKIVPAMLMAAARLDLSLIHIYRHVADLLRHCLYAPVLRCGAGGVSPGCLLYTSRCV